MEDYMRRGQGGRVEVPTVAQIPEAIQNEMEMAACAGLRHGPLAALTISLSGGGEATIFLDELGAIYLFEAVKALFPNIGSGPASHAIIDRTPAGDIQVRVGHKSG
jgi:hypothetical protein